MTFKKYVAKQRTPANALGDFVRLTRTDANLPEVGSWAEMKAYLEAKGVPPRVIEAGATVWMKYQGVRRHEPQA